jgi:hypothetical protein
MGRENVERVAVIPWLGWLCKHQVCLRQPAKEQEGGDVERAATRIEYSGEILLRAIEQLIAGEPQLGATYIDRARRLHFNFAPKIN